MQYQGGHNAKNLLNRKFVAILKIFIFGRIVYFITGSCI